MRKNPRHPPGSSSSSVAALLVVIERIKRNCKVSVFALTSRKQKPSQTMKFGASALLGLLLMNGADAFSINRPHARLVQEQKLANVAAQNINNNNNWRAPMKMVAGGAERAYGEDYYDGTYKYVVTGGSLLGKDIRVQAGRGC